MNKIDLCKELEKHCLVAIVRFDQAETLVRVVRAVAAGGVKAIEVTMTCPDALDIIRESAKELGGDIILGAGTVLDPETARMAMLAGARYIVTPTTSEDTIRMCNRYGVPIMSGAFTPTEILRAWDAGSSMVKVFPATVGGPAYIKAVKGPLPQIPLVPTGGVDLDTIEPFLRAGASALGVGGSLVRKDLIAEEDFQGLTGLAKQFVDKVNEVRGA